MPNKIVCGARMFADDHIQAVELHIASCLRFSQLEADTITATVKSNDRTITRFLRNTPVYYYYREQERFRGYLKTVDQIGPNTYSLSATSAVGLLMERAHAGGIYTGQTAETVIREIVGSLPLVIKNSIRGQKLYGWLPYAKPPDKSARDNMVQVLFAMGAALKTGLDGVLQVVPLWGTPSGVIDWDHIDENAKVQYRGAVSSVTVTEHHYMVGGDEETLFEGDALSGDIVTFSEPMYGLSATGFKILSSNANYAKLSAGSGTLKGHKYVHNTRQITRPVAAGVPESVQSVEDATLISLVNSGTVAERLADYYKHVETIECGVVLGRQSPGDVLDFYHPYDRTNVSACVETLDITASGILLADVKALVGYLPKQVGQTVIYDQHQVITSSGTVTLPDGVTSVRAVLIGGGTGGKGGKKGSNGTAGTNCTTVRAGKMVYGSPGVGGNGGDGGSGGSGGKIAIFDITGPSIKTLTASIGTGGSGGKVNEGAGSAGSETTLTVNGTTYSSATGAVSSAGYQDLVTGIIYAKTGTVGKAGAKGGDGGSSEENPSTGKPGSAAGSNKGGAGGSPKSTYYPNDYGAIGNGGGGGGGAAYNAPGGAGGLNGSGTGSTGGTGAAGTKPAAATVPGSGGTGGNGGGGGGGGGGSWALVSYGQTGTLSSPGGPAGTGGSGGPGGNGAPGCVIFYYGVPQKVKAGSPTDKNEKFFLDKLGRLLVV